jgi:hypothetical protein
MSFMTNQWAINGEDSTARISNESSSNHCLYELSMTYQQMKNDLSMNHQWPENENPIRIHLMNQQWTEDSSKENQWPIKKSPINRASFKQSPANNTCSLLQESLSLACPMRLGSHKVGSLCYFPIDQTWKFATFPGPLKWNCEPPNQHFDFCLQQIFCHPPPPPPPPPPPFLPKFAAKRVQDSAKIP